MKLFHICMGRPIGATFTAYIEKPILIHDEDDVYGTWVEGTTLEALVNRFEKYVLYAKENFPLEYFPYELKIRYKQKDGEQY